MELAFLSTFYARYIATYLALPLELFDSDLVLECSTTHLITFHDLLEDKNRINSVPKSSVGQS
ncbi:uncharacterized protein PHALS_14855 [Plasmopara halstedii]|uniref:Uncharacterized protein n=1 Tax=Plasmopara halstedii TaxID=4781 RepID=A0A0P1AYS5_PLAHL|nr:uncharacterized protein PHALS_14855 [Plasmopara halstedii]CEG45999.1 hypothetical protein PHALS_14855 [Plasmopara halstedii]|eukprot:XP_024582368.1 hypothetical protein PHALS_14855 [Plasmopara halstedii]